MSGRREDAIAWLVSTGRVRAEALTRATTLARRSGRDVADILSSLGELVEADLARALSHASGWPLWDPSEIPMRNDEAAKGFSADFLRRVQAAPLGLVGDRLCVAICDPFDDDAITGLRFGAGRELELRVVTREQIREALGIVGAASEAAERDEDVDDLRLERDLALVEDRSVEGRAVDLVQQAFAIAVERGASDIHFEPRRLDFQVRLRIDGRLIDFMTTSPDLAGPCVSRIKILSNLDVGERRLPQDGRAAFVTAGRRVDVRVATAPTVYGETAVLRLLDHRRAPQSIHELGFSAPLEALLRRAVACPHGLFLVTGPTGSGKTTTLYAILAALQGSGKKILSVEDPVERHFDHVAQTQVHPQIGLDFAACLRAFLRHDPDVVLVGEIRDAATAAIALQAAMTGHLVLASLHANTSLAVAPRLVQMGVVPYQLAAALKGALAQRLVRKLCDDCKVEIAPDANLAGIARRIGGEAPSRAFAARGCIACRGLGFSGRLAVAEGFWADPSLLALVGDGATLQTLEDHGRAHGFATLAQDGLRLIDAGFTTVDELLGIAETV
ncbi:MAG: GspE/PulE family protein [Caulobacterales bacterium]